MQSIDKIFNQLTWKLDLITKIAQGILILSSNVSLQYLNYRLVGEIEKMKQIDQSIVQNTVLFFLLFCYQAV